MAKKGTLIRLPEGKFNQDVMDNIRKEELSKSYQDNMYLDDIQVNDEEMVKDALKNCKHYDFGQNLDKCLNFMGFCVESTLNHCGVTIPLAIRFSSASDDARHAEALDAAMRIQKVKLERRRKYKGGNAWRNGFYIYKADVLAGFISEPLRFSPLSVALNQGKTLGIVTNAPIEGRVMVAG